MSIATATILALIVGELLGLGLNWRLSHGSSEQPKSRSVVLDPGAPIPPIVLSDDELILVERGGPVTRSTVNTYVPTRNEDLSERARSAHVIAVVEFVRSESMLVDKETWIETNVTLVARQVIKDTDPSSLQADARIAFRHYGGEMSIGRATVRADHFYLFRTGEQYLVFIRNTDRERNGLVGFPFRIAADGRLAPMMLSSGKVMTAASPLYDMDLKTVTGELMIRLKPQ